MERLLGTMKILLVDDEPFVLRVLTQQLNNLGLTDLHTHEHAHAALAEIEADPEAFELIFCDLQMPKMDGVEFVRHLARLEYSGDLVLISGEDTRILQTAERLAQAQRLHVLGSLRKPTTPDELREILKHSSAVSPARAAAAPFDAAELQRAIASGELVNHYQPKVDLASGALVGVETLVRWQHPEAGLVFPDRFITTAEQNGLIEPLTQAVLAGALQQTRRWLDAGLDLHVAVNVSMESLTDLGFPDRVIEAAADARVPLDHLVLEVTESVLMRDPVAPADILTRLRLKHVGVSIDDFGTGHSSLVKLRDIPFNELKIDRGFVHGAAGDAALRTIVEASLGMARQLGIRPVAEGVEDQDDWDFLRAAGCDLAQGYFMGRPMPAGQLTEWLHEWGGRKTALIGQEAEPGDGTHHA